MRLKLNELVLGVDVLGADVLGADILGVDILGADILDPSVVFFSVGIEFILLGHKFFECYKNTQG